MTGRETPLTTFLGGRGTDHRGRGLHDLVAFSDDRLEAVHDYIQWLFPLPERSGAQPGSPVLTEADVAVVRADVAAQANLRDATLRMLAFYRTRHDWLRAHDHNHLRISRIVRSLGLLVGPEAASGFHAEILALNAAAGSPVDAHNVAYWNRALAGVLSPSGTSTH
jgi:hypothetical protein